ncbi:hypothetical protein [Nitrosomonas sp. H1_AOB3]|uniref:hypothetical protein n=1 Tax=Nitrosomonas sp. H1_AOB3 TaxID=2741553 RepID=UPI0019390569|nr:hypothetical protein [Nitrosomonas sp. H1_AOB3]QOJ09366.1 MAG: hypothetical protein HRU73_07820 [Nitrosomonas sp. H1_AOB3]
MNLLSEIITFFAMVSNPSRAAGIAAGKNTLEYSKVFGEAPDDPGDGHFPSFSLQI